ncbi:uncharacterized protein B0H64DRAFT_399694 [Chaetomium fimeti]|uniref:Uncharacterized protein n=1 Tax=Chaetomium fimeti TaxID=1854472 RepID=A0AAE0LRE5_9PEZI|nr:hypothetical protein B0H64DRAFT_399694 [Chaetomium fimeti]
MRRTTILSVAAFLLDIRVSAATPVDSPPSEVGQPCGQTLGDCAGNLTCIPLSTDCTRWVNSSNEGCPGTCQEIDISKQQIYTLCGGWSLIDDCNERIESCIADPRTADSCGPSCDGSGICWPFAEICGGEEKLECPKGKACFNDLICLPLRFGSDYYEKTSLEEVTRTDQDGWQGDK